MQGEAVIVLVKEGKEEKKRKVKSLKSEAVRLRKMADDREGGLENVRSGKQDGRLEEKKAAEAEQEKKRRGRPRKEDTEKEDKKGAEEMMKFLGKGRSETKEKEIRKGMELERTPIKKREMGEGKDGAGSGGCSAGVTVTDSNTGDRREMELEKE